MSKFIVISGPRIRWKIDISSPRLLTLKSLPGYRFLNPYKWGEAYNNNHCSNGIDGTLMGKQFQVYTSGIILQKLGDDHSDSDIEYIFSNLGNLLKYLKYTANQFNLKYNGSVSSLYRSDGIRPAISASIFKTNQMIVRGDYYNSMATWEHLKKADKLCSQSFPIPVFEDIILDAIDGKTNHEYRKAILYSTIAIESMLANKYDEDYRNLLTSNVNNKKFRKTLRNGSMSDPIFKTLSDKTDFKRLLHEIPLYLYGKSLLMEDEQLYADTLKLYTTRNKIVHWGAPLNPNYDQMLEINETGTQLAIQIAIKLFSWMGIDKFNQLNQNKHIELKEA
jgi:hypothetical protein